jgi:histidinol-phosphate phosphatase family protein
VDDRPGHRAALLDRDGTIIVDREYVNDPAAVELLPGAALAIRRLTAEGIPSIVCTNQSGIARGLISLAQYRAVHLRMLELLAAGGAELLDTFSCPHHPDFTGPCACRKPGTLLYERAAALHHLDLSRCLFAGDRYRDLAVGVKHGGRTVLISSPATPAVDRTRAEREGITTVGTLLEAVDAVLADAT